MPIPASTINKTRIATLVDAEPKQAEKLGISRKFMLRLKEEEDLMINRNDFISVI